MTRYLISFDDGTMVIPEGEFEAISDAAHAVLREAKEAGVWVTGGGIDSHDVSVVGTDGSVAENPHPADKVHLGGFSIVDVPSREEALRWAAKFAVACRCAQDVRELMPDPEV